MTPRFLVYYEIRITLFIEAEEVQDPRVFMVGWEYPPHNSGGLGVACEGLTHALADQNTQIYFTLPYQVSGNISHMQVLPCEVSPALLQQPPFLAYSPSISHAMSTDELIEGVQTHSSIPQSLIEQHVHEYSTQVQHAGEDLQQSFDIIHAHDWMSFPGAVELQKKTDKPFVAHIHSTEMDRIPGGKGSQFIMETEYNGLQAATKVIAVSYLTRRVLIEKYNVDPAKIEVVHNGIAPLPGLEQQYLGFASDRPVIVFMGRLTAQKGAEYFLALAHAVVKKMPKALFVVAGNGDQYHSLLFRTAAEKLSASVLFTDFLRDHQREALLNRADVFVMPSLSEPFGLVALEAAQRNTPVIISENSGVKEILQKALVADFWDIEKMSGYVQQLIEDPAFRQKILSGQASDMKKSSWDTSATKVSAVYRKLLQRFR